MKKEDSVNKCEINKGRKGVIVEMTNIYCIKRTNRSQEGEY